MKASRSAGEAETQRARQVASSVASMQLKKDIESQRDWQFFTVTSGAPPTHAKKSAQGARITQSIWLCVMET